MFGRGDAAVSRILERTLYKINDTGYALLSNLYSKVYVEMEELTKKRSLEYLVFENLFVRSKLWVMEGISSVVSRDFTWIAYTLYTLNWRTFGSVDVLAG